MQLITFILRLFVSMQNSLMENVSCEANYSYLFPLLKMFYLVRDMIICRIFAHIPQKFRHSKQSKLFRVLFRLNWPDESFFKMTAPLPLRRDAKVMQTNPGFDFLWRFPVEDYTGGHPRRFQKLLLRGLGSGTERKLSLKTVGDKCSHGARCACVQCWAVPVKPAHATSLKCAERKARLRLWGCVLSQCAHWQEMQ